MRIYMNVFIGQTRAAAWIRTLESYGFGEMCSRSELPPRRHPWAFDNGAFADWNAGRPAGMSDLSWLQQRGPLRPEQFNARKYEASLDTMHLVCTTRPEVLIVPDLVAGGAESLAFSRAWVDRVRPYGPLYLAVQDGMTELDVDVELDGYSGVFVGGSARWKIKTGGAWVAFAHARGLKCHIGRVGTEKKVRWARRIGADSIDSALPLWSAENLARFLRGFQDGAQLEMAS